MKPQRRICVRAKTFFFRPSPSRLSPGRNTVFVPVNELCIAYVSMPHWGVKKERGPLRSPESNPGCKRKMGKPNKKQNKRTKTKTKPNKTNPKSTTRKGTRNTPFDGRALSKKAASVPMNSRKILQKAKQPTRHHRKITVKVQKHNTDQQCRNPGSPQPGSRRSHCEAQRA